MFLSFLLLQVNDVYIIQTNSSKHCSNTLYILCLHKLEIWDVCIKIDFNGLILQIGEFTLKYIYLLIEIQINIIISIFSVFLLFRNLIFILVVFDVF